LNYNDVKNEDSELLRNALIFGRSFEINYIDEDGKQRFKVLDTRECIPVYDTTLNNDLLYIIRYYLVDNVEDSLDKYFVEVYGKQITRTYESSNRFSSFSLLEEKIHHYNQVPITVFSLNKEEESIFDKIITLQDAYNKLLSSEVDDFEAFCDAYLVLKGCIAEEEDI
jgi:SPP1 family phage portal protein